MPKRICGVREWLLIALAAFLLLAALILPVGWALADEQSKEEQQLWAAYQSGDLIRLHVIANSDSPKDQTVKLHVRDALIDAFGQMLVSAGSQSSDCVYELLEKNVGHMQQVAQDCVQSHGCVDKASAEVGVLHLPAKQYGRVTLPEGEYRALRITLGDGEGQNWWCVLFPQLCLSLAQAEQPSDAPLYWSSERIFSQWLLMSK